MMWSIRLRISCIDRDHPFGVELAERNLQPAAMVGHFVNTVQLKIEQFPDPQPAGPLQPQRGSGQGVLRASRQDLGEASVDVDGKVARQRPRQFGGVVAEQQLARWRIRPAPLGDVGQETSHGQHSTGSVGDGDRLAGPGVQCVDQRGQVRLDMTAPVQPSQRCQSWVGIGQEHAEVSQPGRDRRHRLGSTGRPFPFQVSDHRGPDRWRHLGQPFVERDRPARSGKLVDHAEMEQHPLGVADRRQIVLMTLPGPPLPVSTRGRELGQVGEGQLRQRTPGLDQQPRRHL